MSNKNLSILFTGQGSQFPEMGIDLASKYSWVKERYQQSSDILGYDVLKKQEDPSLQAYIRAVIPLLQRAASEASLPPETRRV